MARYNNEPWNNKFGNNFTDSDGIHNDMMLNKNMETNGAYQASVSGMYGEFTIAAVFKSLPNEYAVMNDILIQTGTQFRKYTTKEFRKYGETPWELVTKLGNKELKPVNKNVALKALANGTSKVFYEVVKKSSQLDHVIVSPYGVFVIETKNHKGMVFGDVNGKVWTQVLNNGRQYGRNAHYTFFNPVHQNELHLKHLSEQAKIPRNYMIGMIVFTNPEASLGNVNCNCCFTLDTLAEAIYNINNPIFTKEQVDFIIKSIDKLNSNGYILSKEHIEYVKDIQHRQEINRMYHKR